MSKIAVRKGLFIALSITGSVVGVGFASGREVVSFFIKYGYLSLIFCLLAGFIFGIFTYLVLSGIFNKNSHKKEKCKIQSNSLKYVKTMRNLHNLKNNFDLFGVVLLVCQVSICSAMFAGFDELFVGFNIDNSILFVIKTLLLLFAILFLFRGVGGVHVVNVILPFIMVLLIIIVFVAGCCLQKYSLVKLEIFSVELTYMPLLYVGMNVLTVIPIMESFADSVNSKKDKFYVSLFVGFFIALCLSLVSVVIIVFGGGYLFDSFVMVSIADNVSRVLGFAYLIVVAFGIITTLLSTGFGASKILSRFVGFEKSVVFVIVLSFVLSFVGFSKIIDIFYPALGLVCLVYILIALSINLSKKTQKHCKLI